MRLAIVSIFLGLIVIAGIVLLQVFLSKKENKWLGLILPLISFGYSLLMVFSLAVYEGMTGWHIFTLIMSVFLTANVPTIILLAIYFACRGSIKRKKALEKMSIQDLT